MFKTVLKKIVNPF